MFEPFGEKPCEAPGSGGDLRGCEGDGSVADVWIDGADGRAPIEAKPAEPEEACAQKCEDERVGLQNAVGVADAFADVDSTNLGRNTGGDMDDCTACKIDGASVVTCRTRGG
jgi:hypothetical protein